jgi:hypothetical protein
MTAPTLSLSWSIFEEPPDDMEPSNGALLVNWNGSTGRDIYDMARAYRAAAFRLLDAARRKNESWESIDPILFCFRHALELHLKALQPGAARRVHPLKDLADELHSRLQGRYRSEHIDWLCGRIREFDRVDSRSTSFRYHDVAEPRREPELWVDFNRFRVVMEAIFEGLEKVRLDSLASSSDSLSP